MCQGDDEIYPSTEAQSLQSARETQNATVKSPGSGNVVSLYGAFIVRGSNEYHQCLVTEVLLPWTGLERILWREFDHRNIIKQGAKGFGFLHRYGIVHGGEFNSRLGHLQDVVLLTTHTLSDPTVANIGIAAPQIDCFAEFDLSEELGTDLSAVPVMTVGRSLPPDTVPAYMINAVSLTQLLSENKLLCSWRRHDLKVIDSGRCKSQVAGAFIR